MIYYIHTYIYIIVADFGSCVMRLWCLCCSCVVLLLVYWTDSVPFSMSSPAHKRRRRECGRWPGQLCRQIAFFFPIQNHLKSLVNISQKGAFWLQKLIFWLPARTGKRPGCHSDSAGSFLFVSKKVSKSIKN